ncbi:MAG TPA: glycosyltransferase family 4 protein [Gammaproteobacteria bacterium]|nr:glycosyltransferase family 4 protein [Gammaproteobacteria bacterium]
MKKLLFLVSEDSYFCSHRLNLACAARQAGFEVGIATKTTTHTQKIQKAGLTVFPLKHFTRAGLNPIRQCQLLLELLKIYKTYRPDIVHQVAIKPVILGSLVALWCRIPIIINALGGLGYLFTDGEISPSSPFSKRKIISRKTAKFKKSVLRFLTPWLFRFIFSRHNTKLILQNQDDLDTLVKAQCISDLKKITIIRGSGIDMKAFPATPFPSEPPVIIACVSRLLWDKGIGELVTAARTLQEKNIDAKIILYGTPDPENPASISHEQIQGWHDSGLIIWQGHCNHVAKAYADCHIAVLPSYREGLPKTLLEAASCERPIITTDVPGCREVVQDGENGLLVPAKNSEELADALIVLIENKALRLHMGQAGRKRVAQYFSDTLIHEETLKLYS